MERILNNRYKLTDQLSSDPLTILYKSQDLHDNKPLLITVLTEKALSRPLEVQLRFKRAVEQASRLKSPNLLKILTLGESDNQTYVIQEYLEAISLSNLLKQPQNTNQPLNTDTAVDIILEVSSALSLCHEQNLIHQAVKPQHILISQAQSPQAGQPTALNQPLSVKLFNFGYSILQDISKITEKEEIISTFGYLSPESSGILRKPIDSRSDIYSLGILFYQLLTGRLPYLAEDIAGLIHQHIATKPTPPSKLNNSIPPVLDNIALRLIAKEPQERYQSLKGLIVDLKEYQRQRKEGRELIDFEIARSDRLTQLSFSTKLIGRDNELNQLKDLLNQTKQGQGNLCFVFGEPGIGKSRLVDELRAHVHSLSGLFCGGKCYQYEFRTPYKVFSESLDAYIEKVKRLSASEQQEHIRRIKETLGELGGEVVKIAPSITDLIGQPPKLVELEPEKEKIRFLITVTNFLTSLSTPDTPLLMFLDDLQWVDDGSLEILERFADKLQNTSTLLIVSYRDTEVPEEHPLAQTIKKLTSQNLSFLSIPVKSFSLSETAQMVSQILLEKEEAIFPLAQELTERAQGNPFFTLELLHSLVDSKVIYLKEEHYTYDLSQLQSASLPTTIVEAVLKRMKDLSAEHMQILSYASVMGKELDFKLLTELINQPTDQILSSIENGIQNQLLYRDLTGKENIFFMHDRIREAFYERVPEEERVPLHRHIAEALEKQYQDNPEPVLYDLAHHFKAGRVEEKALQYSIPAAHKAKESYANALAIGLYNTAKEILERQNKKESKQYIEVLENLGEVYRLSTKFDESLKALKACESLISSQDKLHKVQILAKIGDTLWDSGKVEDSAKVLEQATEILGVRFPSSKLGVILGILKEFIRQMFHTWFPKAFVSEKYQGSLEDLVIVRILNRLAHTYYFSDLNRALYMYLKSLNLSEKMGPCSELAYAYIDGGPIWGTLAWFSRSSRDLNKGIKMAQELGDKIREGCGYAYYTCFVGYLPNNPKDGLEAGQKSLNLLGGYGEYWDLGVGLAFRDLSNCIMGRLKEALKGNAEFIAIAKEANTLQNWGWGLFLKGYFTSLIGDVDDTTILDLKEANTLAYKTRDKPEVVYSLSYLSFAYLRKKEYSNAISTIEQAIELYPTHSNMGKWLLDIFPIGAQIYLDTIVNATGLSTDKKQQYLKRAKWFCGRAKLWSLILNIFLGWSLQVNGTYLWLTGHKKRAVRTWDKALHWLRTNKNNPGGDKYRIAYILLEEAKFLLEDDPRDKKALGYLLEAKELFSSMGCQLDLETCNKLLSSILPAEGAVESREALTQRRHLESLYSVTKAIGSVFILDELLERILDYALKVTGAERGFLLLNDEKSGLLNLKISHGTEIPSPQVGEGKGEGDSSAFSFEGYKISLELIREAINKKDVLIASQEQAPNPKIQNELKNYSIKQALAAYLQARDKPLGIIYLDSSLSQGTFQKEEFELMQSFAIQASVSIENAHLVSDLLDQARLKQELELGREIQMDLLPKTTPQIPGISLAGLMLPAKEIGGDYYDFLPYQNQLSVVIGDVSGKGVAAGLLMAMVKTCLYALNKQLTSPKEILLSTNQMLYEHIAAKKFMTMLYLTWQPQTKTLTYSSAGHEHILIYRTQPTLLHPAGVKEGGYVESILSGGFMLGMLPDIEQYLEDRQITLEAGDKVILYTDGVTESRNQAEELFTLKRLIEIVSRQGHKPAQELLQIIKDEVYNFIGTREQYDDITLVVMEAT